MGDPQLFQDDMPSVCCCGIDNGVSRFGNSRLTWIDRAVAPVKTKDHESQSGLFIVDRPCDINCRR